MPQSKNVLMRQSPRNEVLWLTRNACHAMKFCDWLEMPAVGTGTEGSGMCANICCMCHSPWPLKLTSLTCSSKQKQPLIQKALVNKIPEATVSGKSRPEKLWRVDSNSDSVMNLCFLITKRSHSGFHTPSPHASQGPYIRFWLSWNPLHPGTHTAPS